MSFSLWFVSCVLLVGPGALAAVLVSRQELPRPAAPQAPPRGFSVEGRIVDSRTLEPLAGVAVTLEQEDGGAAASSDTDADGVYRLAGVPTGAYTIRAELTGYRPWSAPLEVGPDAAGAPRPGPDVALSPVRAEERPADVSSAALTTEIAASRRSVRSDLSVQHSRLAAAPVEGAAGAPPRMKRMGVLAEAAAAPVGRFAALYSGSERYADRRESDFSAATASAFSTFSVDVDRASYSNVRRFLAAEGALPPASTVRVEEIVNYFDYGWASPESGGPRVAVSADVAPSPWHDGRLAARVAVRTAPVDLSALPPVNLVFVFDVSGSMSWNGSLGLLKSSSAMLLQRLRPADRVSIVAFSHDSFVHLASTPAAHRRAVEESIDTLYAGGGTAGEAGLRLAYREARRSHAPGGLTRIVLGSDGDFNVGETGSAALADLVRAEKADGVHLTVLAVGRGNYNDETLTLLARAADGQVHYLDSLLEARRALVEDLGGVLDVVGRDVKVQVEFNPRRVAAYRLIGYEDRMLAAEDFSDASVPASDLGAGHTVTALYEIVPAGGEVPGGRGVETRYGCPDAGSAGPSAELFEARVSYKPSGSSEPVTVRAVQGPLPDGGAGTDPDLSFALAAATFGMLLRRSEHAGCASWTDVARLARAGQGDEPSGRRAEFVRLADIAATLTAKAGVRSSSPGVPVSPAT